MKSLPIIVGLLWISFATHAGAQVMYYSSSTAGEGYQRGAASMISAQGEKNLNDSQARINNQDAYSAALDNSVKAVNTYWEKKDIYNQRLAQKHYEIGQERDAYLARHRLEPLATNEFDRTTGAIAWPKILQQSQFDNYRNTLDEMFKKRASEGALTGDDYMAATAAAKAWRTQLNGMRNEYPLPILQQMVRFVLKVSNDLDENLS